MTTLPAADEANDWPTHRVTFSAHAPHIIVVAPGGLNSEQARELAAALVQAADELDGWAAR